MNAEIDRAVVEGLVKRGIKVLAMRCAGYSNADFKAAYDAGLTVVRVPAYSPYAVAEHAAALLLSLTRHIHKAAARTRDFNFSLAGVAIVSCNDGLRPAIMKLEATENESQIDDHPIKR